jgi:hypothetical protein
MGLPEPVPGLVIRYAYLWLDEHRQGLEEGVKDRPCAVILVTEEADWDRLITVLPSPIRRQRTRGLRSKFRR